MVRKSVSLSQEAIDIIEDYRRRCKGNIPSFSEAIETLIYHNTLIIKQGLKPENKIKELTQGA